MTRGSVCEDVKGERYIIGVLTSFCLVCWVLDRSIVSVPSWACHVCDTGTRVFFASFCMMGLSETETFRGDKNLGTETIVETVGPLSFSLYYRFPTARLAWVSGGIVIIILCQWRLDDGFLFNVRRQYNNFETHQIPIIILSKSILKLY